MTAETFELPLLPLPTVLFPGMSIQLKVACSGQRAMLQEALEHGNRLGIVLVKSVASSDSPLWCHQVGTVSTLLDAPADHGPILFLDAVGEHRFRLLRLLQQEPYVRAVVEQVGEPLAEVPCVLVDRVREAFFAYLETRTGLVGGWLHKWAMQADGAVLSSIVGQFIDAVPSMKQALLETSGPTERLQKELEVLTYETELLRQAPRRGPLLATPGIN